MGYDYLPTVTKKAIGRKIFNKPPSPNFNANTTDKQVDVLKKIIKELEGVEDIKTYDVINHEHYGVRTEIRIQYNGHREVTCSMRFGKNNDLSIHLYPDEHHLGDVSQLIALKNAIQKAAIVANEKAIESKANSLKRDKIKELKKKAIIAKALELVQLENVPYVIDDSFTTKIVVFIRLSETVRLEVNVPYSNYQIVLQNTQAAIKAIREFADKGIAINVRTSGATTPFYKWKLPNK